jgi:plastocyanin
MFSRSELPAWGLAVVVVVIMGIIALHGPFGKINKGLAEGPTATPSTKPFNVKIETNVKHPQFVGQFVPDPAVVHVGQEVIFTNVSNAPHTVTIPGKVDSGIINISGTFTKFPTSKPGTYHYKCTIHPGMVGTLIVKP